MISIAAKVCGIAHAAAPSCCSRIPWPCSCSRLGCFDNEIADASEIVTPDRVDEFAGLDQPRPARCLITAGECELRIGKFGLIRRDRLRMMLVEFFDRGWIAAPDVAKQILRLVLELIEVGTDGKVTI